MAVLASVSIKTYVCDRNGEKPQTGLKEADMRVLSRRMHSWVLLGMVLVVSSVLGASRPAGGVELGEPAPPFTLASTTGGDISLNDYRGKKWVLLEFYGVDFAPT